MEVNTAKMVQFLATSLVYLRQWDNRVEISKEAFEVHQKMEFGIATTLWPLTYFKLTLPIHKNVDKYLPNRDVMRISRGNFF